MLISLGYQVIIAFDGQDGVEQLIKNDTTIDLLLMDHSMPRMDGVAATKEIRRLEAAGALSRRRPIIALTAVVNPAAQVNFKDAGADEFLSKPLALDRLRDTLNAFLPGSR
jgi:CheY-like chemotaxis protein